MWLSADFVSSESGSFSILSARKEQTMTASFSVAGKTTDRLKNPELNVTEWMAVIDSVSLISARGMMR